MTCLDPDFLCPGLYWPCCFLQHPDARMIIQQQRKMTEVQRATGASHIFEVTDAPSGVMSSFSAVWFLLLDPLVLFSNCLLLLSRDGIGLWKAFVSMGTKKGEIVVLSGLLMESVLCDTIFASVVMELFREMSFAQESVVNPLEYLVLFVLTTRSWCVVDDGISVDGSIWFITVVCCSSKCVAFKILSLSRVLDEERVFRYVGRDCSKTSKSGSIPER